MAYTELKPARPALIVIDLQKSFHQGSAVKSMDGACGTINAILPRFRDRGLPVIWVQHRNASEDLVEGKEGFAMIDCLKPAPGESIVIKEYGNAFNKTGLAKILKESGINTVVLAGYCAEYCVLSTYRGAKDLDLVPMMLSDALASGDEENIGFVLRISETISSGALSKFLENC